jgi:hypothetical protein
MTLTPYVTRDRAPDHLREAVAELIHLDAVLNANIPESLRAPLIHLQRQVNSYYSIKIEGNSASPASVLSVHLNSADGEPVSDLLEIKHHIEAQTRSPTTQSMRRKSPPVNRSPVSIVSFTGGFPRNIWISRLRPAANLSN